MGAVTAAPAVRGTLWKNKFSGVPELPPDCRLIKSDKSVIAAI
jgi:hypothetical protein